MFSDSKSWRAAALALLIVTGTLAMVSTPLPIEQNSGVASATTSDESWLKQWDPGESSRILKYDNGTPYLRANSDVPTYELSYGDDPRQGSKYTIFEGEYRLGSGAEGVIFNFKENAEAAGIYSDGSIIYPYTTNTGNKDTLTNGLEQRENEWVKFRIEIVSDGDSERIKYTDLDTGNSVTSEQTASKSSWNTLKFGEGYYRPQIDYRPLESQGVAGDGDLTGAVEDQDGLPIAGASVEAYGVQTSKLPNGTTAEELINDASNAKPSNFDQSLDFGSFASEASGTYPLIHSREDWGLTGWTEGVDVGSPQVLVSAGEPLVVSAWDPSAGSTTDGINSIYNTWPGRPEGGQTVQITPVDVTGSPVGSTQTYETSADDTYLAPTPTQPGKAGVSGLSAGFYRISVSGSSASYLIAATPSGGLDSLLQPIQTSVEDGLDKIPQNVKEVQDALDSGAIKRYTTTTDADGEFGLNVDSGVNRVAIQAARARTFSLSSSSDTDYVTQVKNSIDHSQDFTNPDVVFTPKPVQTDVPGQVTVETVKLKSSMLEACNPELVGDDICSTANSVADQVKEEVDDTIDRIEDELSDLEQQLIDLITDLDNLSQSQINAYLEQSQFSSLPTESDVRDLSRQELRQEIRYATEAITGVSTDPIEDLDLIRSIEDLITQVQNANAVSEYLSNSQFSEIPTRDQLAGLSRQELNTEFNALQTALGESTLPEPPEEPPLDPFREELKSLLLTVDSSDPIRDAYLETSRFDSVPTDDQINSMSGEVLLAEIDAAESAIDTAPSIPAPDPVPEPDPGSPPDLTEVRDHFADLINEIDGSGLESEYLNDSRFGSLPSETNINSLSQSDLYDEVNIALTVLEDAEDGGDGSIIGGGNDTELPDPPGEGLDMDVPTPSSVDPNSVTVSLEWADGSTDVMDDSYYTIDDALVGDGSVQIRDYPLSIKANGRSLADVVVRSANDNGRSEQRIPIQNPAFSGDIPRIDAVDVSTTRPGPNQWVSVQLRPNGDSYSGLESVDIYDPEGNLLEVTRRGEEARFRTDGPGVYKVRMNYRSQTGERFQKTVAVEAGETGSGTPPLIRMADSPGGTYAVAGEGFDTVELDDPSTPNDLSLSAVIPGDGDVPGEVYLLPNGIQLADETSVSLAVLRGDSQRQIREHMELVVVSQRFGSESIAYRGEDQPITRDGATRYGEISVPGDGEPAEIATYTDADGVVTVSQLRDPSIVEETIHYIRTINPVSFGSLFEG